MCIQMVGGPNSKQKLQRSIKVQNKQQRVGIYPAGSWEAFPQTLSLIYDHMFWDLQVHGAHRNSSHWFVGQSRILTAN